MSRKKRLQDKAEKSKKAEQKRQAYVARVAAKKTKKKRTKKSVSEGRAYVQSTFNNTLVTITDNQGEVIGAGSAGREGFKGSKKSTSYAASKAATSAIMHAKNFGLEKVHIFVKGVGTGRDAAIRSIAGAGVEVLSIKDVTPIPHNGPRARKARRV